MKPAIRAMLTTAAALTLGACTMWKPHPALTPSTQFHGPVLVTRAGHPATVVHLPAVTGDSLTGTTPADQRVAIPLSEIQTAYTRRTDAIRTVAAVGAAVVAALVVRSATHSQVVY